MRNVGWRAYPWGTVLGKTMGGGVGGRMGGGARLAARVPVVVANSWKLRLTDGGPAGMKIVCWADE